MVTHIFLFGFQYPCKDLLFPHSHNPCKNISVLGGTVLKARESDVLNAESKRYFENIIVFASLKSTK